MSEIDSIKTMAYPSHRRFEAQLAVTGDREKIEELTAKINWKLVVNDGVFYCSRKFNTRLSTEVVVDATRTVANVMKAAGAKILRMRVDLVMLDEDEGEANASH